MRSVTFAVASTLSLVAATALAPRCFAQDSEIGELRRQVERQSELMRHRLDILSRQVDVLEVERLIQAFEAEGTTGFEYEIFEDVPGGHAFDRMDFPRAREIREKIWRFLAEHLRPERPARE